MKINLEEKNLKSFKNDFYKDKVFCPKIKRIHVLNHNFVTACQDATRIGVPCCKYVFLNAHKKFHLHWAKNAFTIV
jgi:hypothetical protein